jgi:glutamate synthase (NADPH) large chain
LILGEIGRNFAAGMSGGIAYIYKEHEALVNPEMVDLDPLEEDDQLEIYVQLNKHVEYTGSRLATEILKDWDNRKNAFIKVFPRDYKAVVKMNALGKSKSFV